MTETETEQIKFFLSVCCHSKTTEGTSFEMVYQFCQHVSSDARQTVYTAAIRQYRDITFTGSIM